MKRIGLYLSAVLLLAGTVLGQKVPHIPFFDEAHIAHNADTGTLTVEARTPRLLEQALKGIVEEYGWLVDYEDPIYHKEDVVDDTDERWRAQHPSAPGGTRLRGERFVFVGSEPGANDLLSGKVAPALLTSLLDAYNASGNPGKFTLTDEGSKRFAVIGGIASLGYRGAFDCTIELNNGEYSIEELLNAILLATSQQVGKQMSLGWYSMNVLSRRITVDWGGSEILARTAVVKALDATKLNLVYSCDFDFDMDQYYVGIFPAVKTSYDSSGKKVTVAIRQR